MTDVNAAVEAIVRINDQQTSAVCEVLEISAAMRLSLDCANG